MLVNGHSNPSDPTVTKRFAHFYSGPCGEYTSALRADERGLVRWIQSPLGTYGTCPCPAEGDCFI